MGRAKKPPCKYSKEMIQGLIASSDKAVIRAVVAIYKRQTDSEKADLVTKCDNGIGFTGVDAFLLSSFAQQVQARNFLSTKQICIARTKMMKYWKQLADVAEERDHQRGRPWDQLQLIAQPQEVPCCDSFAH